MSEIAFTINGEPFEVPPRAAYWRPRRVRDRGLEVVYKRDGCVPLILPITIGADEFRREVGGLAGKYRLDALDEEYQPIEGVPAAYLLIQKEDPAATPASPASTAPPRTSAAPEPATRPDPELSETATLLREVVRVNAEVTRTLAERYSTVMEAAAHLVRAADGAGMPARIPHEPRNAAPIADVRDDGDEGDGGDDDGDERDWFGLIYDLATSARRMMKGEPPLRNAGKPATSGAGASGAEPPKRTPRKARAAAPADASAQPDAPAAPAPDAAPTDTMPPMTPAMMLHLNAIKARLTEDEVAFIKEVMAELSTAEIAGWVRELAAMPVDDAVAAIREQIRGGDRDDDERAAGDAQAAEQEVAS